LLSCRKIYRYPYSSIQTNITLNDTDPFSAEVLRTPQWAIRLEPATEDSQVWDNSCKIREHYNGDIFNQKFRSWIWQFSSGYRGPVLPTEDIGINENVEVGPFNNFINSSEWKITREKRMKHREEFFDYIKRKT
jgi:hypothetical protein